MHTNKLEEKKHDNPPKLKQRAADLSDTGVVSDQLQGGNGNENSSMNGGGEQHEDSFQRMYSKELDLDEDEVPIILHELNDSAIHFISRDQYERALSLLQKAQTLIDRLQFQRNPNDRFIVLLTMHNMALCFQKLGALEECALCLEASLQSINSPFLLPKFQGDPSRKLKKLKYECKAHMQVCALLSQLHRHKEALQHAEKSVMIAQYMIKDLLSMCQYYQVKVLAAKKNEQIAQELMMIEDAHQQNPQNRDLIYYDDTVSMLERTAYRILPIIQEVASRMVKTQQSSDDHQYQFNNNSVNVTEISELMKQKLNMKAVLGYLNQSEWLYLLNIGNIMQITPLTVHDLYSNQTFEVELTRDAILEKISFLAVSYFCISTELRFLVQVKDDPTIDPARKKKESEFWHAKALEISCSFLPSESPLVSHILTSYQKHHAPVQHEIPEDQEQQIELKVIRPLPGIDICKFQPMVRQDETLNISIPQLPLSPNNYAQPKRRQSSIDPKATQIMSLPFSPHNQATTANASQNNLFSSQLGNKIQTTDSSTTNLVPSQRQTQSTNNGGGGGNSQINPSQQQQQHNRFNKNKNVSQKKKALVNNLNQQQQQNITTNDGIEVNQQVLENDNDDINNTSDDQNTSYIMTNNNNNNNDQNGGNNRSMLDIMPSSSANYNKLLNDFRNIQNSADILEELNEDDDQIIANQNNQKSQFFDNSHQEDIIQSDNEDDDNNLDQNQQTRHQESQEVEIVMEEMNKRRKKQQQQQQQQQLIKTRSNSAQQRRNKNGKPSQQQQHMSNNGNRMNQLNNQVLDISQEYIDYDEDDDNDDNESEDEDEFFDDKQGHSKSKQHLRMQNSNNNLSMDGARMKRPQTSQGIRKNFKHINHKMIMHTDSNNTMRQQQQQSNLQNQNQQDLMYIKANTVLGVIPSADGVSPNNIHNNGRVGGGILGNRQIHNQSAAATTTTNTHGKVSKNQTATNGFNIVNSSSGNHTDLQGNSTPVKSASMGRGAKGSAKYNRENMNMSRANLDQRTNQSSSSELMQQQNFNTTGSKQHQQQRPRSKQKRIRNIQEQTINNNSTSGGVQQQPMIANNQMPHINNNQLHSNSNKRIQGAINNNSNNGGGILNTQINSHNHSQMLVTNNNNISRMNGGSNTSQGFYNKNQQHQQQQHRSNSSHQKKQHLNYSGGKSNNSANRQQHFSNNNNIANNSMFEMGFNTQQQQQQQLQMQLLQQQQQTQQQKYMTATANNNNNNSINDSSINIKNNQKTLQDLFMIDRLVKKRTNLASNTHEQAAHNQSFEMGISQHTTDPKYNSQHLHNSNSRSKSRSKLTTSRSKDKHHNQNGNNINNNNNNKTKSNGFTTTHNNNNNFGIIANGSQSALNNSTMLLDKSTVQQQQQQQQQNIEELKRQILLKQALLESNKNSNRRKSTGNLNTSASAIGVGGQQQQQQQMLMVQNGQQKKRVENANSNSNSNSLQQTQQQNASQQWIQAQITGQKSNLNINTHQMIKKFLKDRNSNQQQQLSNSNSNLNNSLINNVNPSQSVSAIQFQPLANQQNQIFSLNNSMLDNYPIQQNLGGNNNQPANLFSSDLSAYKMQLSKKIMQQQQKLLGAATSNDAFNMNAANGSGNKRQNSKKQQQNTNYITESHPKKQQQQRSATPIFEMYESVTAGANGQSRTHKQQIPQSNSLGMYMSNLNPSSKKDININNKSLADIGNFNIINNNQSQSQSNNNNNNLATYLKDFQNNLQQQQDMQNQSLREDSFIKSMKKSSNNNKNSKKATPKNVIPNNQQFSWI